MPFGAEKVKKVLQKRRHPTSLNLPIPAQTRPSRPVRVCGYVRSSEIAALLMQ